MMDNLGKRLLLAVIILAVIAVLYFVYCNFKLKFSIKNTRSIMASHDGEFYRVHNSPDGGDAANALARLHGFIITLLRYLRKKYLINRNQPQARVIAVEKLLSRYNPDNLVENSPDNPEGDTAYSLDKGAVMAICLRDKRPGKYGKIHDMEILIFVTIHEMAHIALDCYDHPPEFWSMFKFLLEEAENAGIFSSPDYASEPQNYCGVLINYSPKWDRSLTSYGSA